MALKTTTTYVCDWCKTEMDFDGPSLPAQKLAAKRGWCVIQLARVGYWDALQQEDERPARLEETICGVCSDEMVRQRDIASERTNG